MLQSKIKFYLTDEKYSNIRSTCAANILKLVMNEGGLQGRIQEARKSLLTSFDSHLNLNFHLTRMFGGNCMQFSSTLRERNLSKEKYFWRCWQMGVRNEGWEKKREEERRSTWPSYGERGPSWQQMRHHKVYRRAGARQHASSCASAMHLWWQNWQYTRPLCT